MAWTQVGDAVPVTGLGGPADIAGYLGTSGTSTIRPTTGPRMFMYGLSGGSVTAAVTDTLTYSYYASGSVGLQDATVHSVTEGAVASDATEDQGLITSFSDGTAEEFVVRPPTATTYCVQSAYLPRSRGPLTDSYLVADWTSSPPTVTATLSSTTYIEYTNPYVLPIITEVGTPLYIMLLVRYRRIGSVGSSTSTSVSDIVCYIGDDPWFRTRVVGPYLLVSGLDALPSQQQRVWVSVPTAFIMGMTMYVYYMVEENAYATTVGDTNAASGTFTPGVAVRAVALHNLLHRAGQDGSTIPSTSTNEDGWESDEATFNSSLVRGRTMGTVNIWYAGGTAGEIESFATVWEHVGVDGNLHSPKVADPCAATSGPHRMLFFSTISESGDQAAASSGFGIWRATAMPPRVSYTNAADGSTVTSTFGVDFIMRGNGVDYQLDQIVDSDVTTLYMDPDVVQLVDGTWWCFAGCLTLDSQLFSADDSEVSIDAEDCWV